VENWSKWKFYPGALFSMPYRLLLMIIQGMLLVLISKIVLIGHDFSKGPVKDGCRKRFVGWLYSANGKLWMFLCGFIPTKVVKLDTDYTEWLGEGYKDNYKKDVKFTSTVVCNHTSWIDTQNLYQHYKLALSLDIGFLKAPIMGTMGKIIDSIFLPRGSSEEKRKQALDCIVNR
jgi:hypothetical protein